MDPDVDEILKRLPPGWGVVSHPRSKNPFVISSRLVTLPKVSDEQLRILMADFWEKYPPQMVGKSVDEKSEELRTELRQLMMEVANHPGMSTTEYCRALGWPASKGSRIKGQLESLLLIKSHPIPLSRRGGGVEAIELLDAGFQKLGLPPGKLPGKGGFIHAWWIARLAKRLADRNPSIEKVLNGKAVDVAVEELNGWVAYEVQRDCRQDLVRDLLSKDLAAGFVRVTVCVQSKDELLRVQGLIAAMGLGEKAAVKSLAEFY